MVFLRYTKLLRERERDEGRLKPPNPWKCLFEGEIPSGDLNRLIHFSDVEFDMRFHFQIFVVSGVNFRFDVFFQVGHLQ